MSNFVNLSEAIESMAADPSTAAQPIKRMLVADGDFVFANVSILEAGQRFAALSVFAPFFDRNKPNIHWERDEA